MIFISGETADELADLQKLLESGALSSDEGITLHINYSLSADGILLFDQYNHIVRESEE